MTILVIPYSWGFEPFKGSRFHHLKKTHQHNCQGDNCKPSEFLPNPPLPSCASRRAIRRSFLRRFRSPGSHKWQKAHCSWREIRGIFFFPNENPYRSPSKRPCNFKWSLNGKDHDFTSDLLHQQFAGSIILNGLGTSRWKNYKMKPFCRSLWVMGLLQMAESKWFTGILTPITWSCKPYLYSW